ncbi:cupredoxin domain-containing protein [Candidatus Pacearchaeota archaeon]|nr:cupredoxin domain-containing protein [Candidatus Pacearchaeota archaeon]
MKKYIIAITIIIILAIFGIFIVKSITGNSIKELNPEIKEFTVKAFKFGYSPDTITVNKGDKVKIIINNTDVLHGIRIPDLGLRDNEILEFTANKTGEFTWYCTNMCGEGHKAMSGKLIVK